MRKWEFKPRIDLRSWGVPFGLRWGLFERNFVILCLHLRFFDRGA